LKRRNNTSGFADAFVFIRLISLAGFADVFFFFLPMFRHDSRKSISEALPTRTCVLGMMTDKFSFNNRSSWYEYHVDLPISSILLDIREIFF
jgi:hypothetical protein